MQSPRRFRYPRCVMCICKMLPIVDDFGSIQKIYFQGEAKILRTCASYCTSNNMSIILNITRKGTGSRGNDNLHKSSEVWPKCRDMEK